MPDPIGKPSARPTTLNADPFVRDFEPDIGENGEVSVLTTTAPGVTPTGISANTDDPNHARPGRVRFQQDAFEKLPGLKGLLGQSVRVDMELRSDGSLVLDRGSPYLAATTTFVAAASAKAIAERNLGVTLPWGQDGLMPLSNYEVDSWDLNAYYAPNERQIKLANAVRPGVRFFDGEVDAKFDPKNTAYNLANVPEVVAHECGHALLDTLKPGTLLGYSDKQQALHSIDEGLADGMAFFVDLGRAEVVQRALEACNYDLTKNNPLASIGDSIGGMFDSDLYAKPDLNKALRTLRNDMRVEPGVKYECHKGGQIISGALYDFFLERAGSYGKTLKPKEAAFAAGEATAAVFQNALKFTPDDGGMSFQDFGRGLLYADLALNKGRNLDALRKVVVDRNLLSDTEVDAALAQHAGWQQTTLPVPGDKDLAAAEQLLPKLRESFQLGDATLIPGRCEKDARGFTRVVYFQPRANKAAEATNAGIERTYGRIARDSLLSQGSFSVVLDRQGRVAGAFNHIGSGASVCIDGIRGDGQPKREGDPDAMITPSGAKSVFHQDSFNHLVPR
ncbi:MAG: hypothetical protein HY901_19735 [Deltaproteobacteria bacterium]|nr:hypothetical protein [Deltaproteobacteria bacterium]